MIWVNQPERSEHRLRGDLVENHGKFALNHLAVVRRRSILGVVTVKEFQPSWRDAQELHCASILFAPEIDGVRRVGVPRRGAVVAVVMHIGCSRKDGHDGGRRVCVEKVATREDRVVEVRRENHHRLECFKLRQRRVFRAGPWHSPGSVHRVVAHALSSMPTS